jgi:predicted secreted hydrolase
MKSLNTVNVQPIIYIALFLVMWTFFPLNVQAQNDWVQAAGPRRWTFPEDHGSHPDYRTEWWYFTGNLEDAAGRPFGYQLTFFRQGIRFHVPDAATAWSLRDLYLAHFAVTDAAAGVFKAEDAVSRAGPGLAGAAEGCMDVWVLDWSARMSKRSIRLDAGAPSISLHLELTPTKPAVLHGRNGLSKKGPAVGQASYYTSITNLSSQGRLRAGDRGEVAVKGTSWFDHEFGSNQLAEDQVGWDWFSLHLSDGRDLMVYLLRRRDGTVEPASSGTLVEADGTSRHLALEEIRVQVLDHWRSPRSGGRYPSRWNIVIPGAGIDLDLAPLLADQELVTEGSTGVVYWEGAVGGQGTSRGQSVSCEGYVELTGYAGSLGGLF